MIIIISVISQFLKLRIEKKLVQQSLICTFACF